MVQKIIPITVLTLGVVFLVGWGTSNNATNAATNTTSTASPVSSSTQLSQNPSPNGEPAVAPEKNPPGDIPDTQAFVAYTSQAGGYQLEVPEGWARQINGANVSFIDKFNGVQGATKNALGTKGG